MTRTKEDLGDEEEVCRLVAQQASRHLLEPLVAGLEKLSTGLKDRQLRALASAVLLETASHAVTLLRHAHDVKLLDGLVDLRPLESKGKEAAQRTERRRLHQAMQNLTRFLLDDPRTHLAPLGKVASQGTPAVHRFVFDALRVKAELRDLSRRYGNLHEEVLRGGSVWLEEDYRKAALNNMRKRWNVVFHDWIAQAVAHYYLLEPAVRHSWVGGGREARSRPTLLTSALRGGRSPDAAERMLPPLGQRLRLLDLGSCGDYFGQEHGHIFDVTALDLAPAEPSVFQCDALKLEVGPPGSQPVLEEGPEGLKRLHRLPAESFDVAVLALLLSHPPSAVARASLVAKARRLLVRDGCGLLVIADAAASVGRMMPGDEPPPWVEAVERAGFQLLKYPEMHFSKLRDSKFGLVNRAACFSFATVPLEGEPEVVPLRLLTDKPGEAE